MDSQTFVNELFARMGLADYRVEIDTEHRHGSVFIHDDPGFIKDHLPDIVESLNYLLQLVARNTGERPLFLDVNNYRKEREHLIVELTRATARKAVATKSDIPLPVMNSYERRLAHMELAAHPEVTTESIGVGKGRYVVIRPLVDGVAQPPLSGSAPSRQEADGSESA